MEYQDRPLTLLASHSRHAQPNTRAAETAGEPGQDASSSELMRVKRQVQSIRLKS